MTMMTMFSGQRQIVTGDLSNPAERTERMGCGADPLPARETSADGERA